MIPVTKVEWNLQELEHLDSNNHVPKRDRRSRESCYNNAGYEGCRSARSEFKRHFIPIEDTSQREREPINFVLSVS